MTTNAHYVYNNIMTLNASEMGKLSAQRRFGNMTKEEKSEYFRKVVAKRKRVWTSKLTPEQKHEYFSRISKMRKNKKVQV